MFWSVGTCLSAYDRMFSFFNFLVRLYIGSDMKSGKFSVKNRVKRETGDSWVVTCHREHIDNQTKVK